MKKLLMAAIAVTSIAATPAMAADAAYTVDATVAPTCTIAATGTLSFGALTSTATSFSAATSNPTYTDTTAYCNQASTKITVTHTDMTASNGHSSPGFANSVAIVPSVATSNHAAYSGDQTVAVPVGAFTSMTVSATATAPSSPLIASAYAGSISITLVPAS